MSGGQSLYTCDRAIRDFIFVARDFICGVLGADAVGVYLHGSLAMGSFYPPKSDIDILAIVRGPLNPDRRNQLQSGLADLSERRPIFGDIEFSAVMQLAALAPKHPLPFEAHYSSTHKAKIKAGTYRPSPDARDPDLAAHITVARARGIALFGPPPQEAFVEIPWADYLAAIIDDLDWILRPGNLSASPYYGILNCCRVLAALRLGPGTIMSKEEGAEWALANLPPEHGALITQALTAYRANAPVATDAERMLFGGPWNTDALARFGEFVREAVEMHNAMR